LEADVRLEARHFVGPGVFHVEHEVDLVALFSVLDERRLPDSQQTSDGHTQPGLFVHLAGESRAGILAELHMPAGQIGIGSVCRAAEEDCVPS